MDDFAAIRAIALRNVVLSDSDDYLLRKIYRTYSKTFHTPLHLVETLIENDVLLHFFEHLFESMEPKDLEAERKAVAETPEELEKRQRLEDKEDAEMFQIQKMVEKEESEGGQLDKVKLPKDSSNIITALKGLSREVNLINDTFGEVRNVEEGIKMSFDDSWDEKDYESDSMGLLTNPSKKR